MDYGSKIQKWNSPKEGTIEEISSQYGVRSKENFDGSLSKDLINGFISQQQFFLDNKERIPINIKLHSLGENEPGSKWKNRQILLGKYNDMSDVQKSDDIIWKKYGGGDWNHKEQRAIKLANLKEANEKKNKISTTGSLFNGAILCNM